MLPALLSDDLPRSRVVGLLLIAIVVMLAIVPFAFGGAKAMSVAAKVMVFVLLVASYDLLLGYTGIVSFAHTMFFGIGAYGISIASTRMGAGWDAIGLGLVCALLVAGLLALAIGLFSLRVKAIFFAMITLAVASAFQTLASQLPGLTGGEDGQSFRVPAVLRPSFTWFEIESLGVEVGGRVLGYYLVFVVVLVSFLALMRVVNSPFGRVLQAIRENDFRAEAIGYRTVVFRTLSNVIGAMFAAIAGALYAIWVRYNGPDTTLAFEIMLDILLIVVIGGMGTMYGAVIGSALFLVAQSYLQDVLAWVGGLLHAVPLAAELFSAERWLLWLGLLFVLSVYYFPSGIVGRLRLAAFARAKRD
ncbi:MAG: branched-chain amino acid ABC transporter permease [Burkholderiaceae bacterium]|nr:branched-chain amino acid ABC transporter permease [Burkholderiaceae bacterium]